MIESMKKWTIERPDKEIVDLLSKELAIPSVHAKILVARGIENVKDATTFLHMDESSLHDPYLLHDMEKAVGIITKTVAENKKIAIYGDYDAGATRF